MWKLTIEDDEGKRTPLSLGRDEYTIGRGEGNSVRLTERNISRKHAVLRRNGTGWVVIDTASYNGSYLNGARVNGEQLISAGDVLQIGDYRLEFGDEDAPRSNDTANAATIPGGGPMAVKPDRLVVVVGPEPGQEFLISQATLMIGRAPELDICLAHSSVSRLHAEVHALGGGRYEIIDKASANGVRVNGSLLKRGLLEAGDSIELGEVKLKFAGAGQAFRLGPEAHRLLAPHEEAEGSTVKPTAPSNPAAAALSSIDAFDAGGRSKFLKNLAVGASIGLVVVLAFFVAARRTVATRAAFAPAASKTEAPNPAQLALAEAKKLAAQGELDAAHARIAADVAGATSLRDSADVRDIEARWADAVLSRADQESDVAARRTLLGQVAQSTTVDLGRRQAAVEKLKEVDYVGTDVHELPRAATKETEKTPDRDLREATEKIQTVGSSSKPTRPVLAADPWSGTTSKVAAEPGDTSKATDLALQGRDGEAKARAALEPRVFGGHATQDEIKMLRAICKHQGDRACSDRASALLSK